MYGGKKYYVATHETYLIKKTTNKIYYFCVNHILNTSNNKFLFKNNKCNGKNEYRRHNSNFYIIKEHNNICDKKDIKIYDNLANVEKTIVNYEEYKEELIDYLNNNPIKSYKNLKKKALDLFLKKDANFTLKKNTLSNIYYKWRANTKIFSWHSIFDNFQRVMEN